MNNMAYVALAASELASSMQHKGVATTVQKPNVERCVPRVQRSGSLWTVFVFMFLLFVGVAAITSTAHYLGSR